MSNTVNVGNFSVECFHSPSPIPVGEPIADYQSVILTLVPDEGYVIDAANFGVIAPLPGYVSSVVFSQSEQNPDNITCLVTLTPGAVMPDSDINIDLCISGRAEFVSYCVSGTVVWNKIAHVTPITLNSPYSLCGSYEQVSNVFTQAISADAGFYFEEAPTIQLSSGNINDYAVSTENVLDSSGNIITTIFTVNYTFPNQNVTNDLWTINGVAQIIYVPTIEISNYTVSTAAFPSQGGLRYYTIFGDDGANWTLTAVGTNGINNILSIDGSTYVNTLTGVLGANGLQEVLVFVPSSSIPQSFDLTISGDLSSPFIQPITVTIAQLANITITYATTSPLGYLVTPGSYTKTGFSYASFLAPNRPTTSINWIVDSNDPATVLIKKPNVQYYDYIQNNDFLTVVFTTSGTGFTHPIPPLGAGVDPLLLPSVVGWNFIGETNYGSSIEVTSIDYVLNTITFNTSITVIANQTETIGNNKSNNVQFDLSVQTSGNGVSIFGSAAVNNFGFANNTFLFLVDELVKEVSLPTIVTTGVSNETGTEADSGGENITDGGGTISSKGIQWSEFADFSTVLGANNEGTGTADFSSTITGLTAGNTYYVRAYAQNEAGIGYGQVIGFVSNITIPCSSTSNSGNAGITDLNINLDSGGGLVALLFNPAGVPDKMEIIHGGPDGTKVATSGFDNGTDGNSGPFDNVYGTETSNTIPTSANVANIDQFIGTNKGVCPTRETQFTTETGYVAAMGTYQQIVWWNYTAADWQNEPNVTIRVTGSTNTGWSFLRLCCPDGNCTPEPTP